MSQSSAEIHRPRELNEWIVCEEYGLQACEGVCPVHRGDACLIAVGWVDNSHVRREREGIRSALWLARAALEDVARNIEDDRLLGVVRVTLERIAEERV